MFQIHLQSEESVPSFPHRLRQQLKALIAHLSARVWDTQHMAWLLFLYYFCTLGCFWAHWEPEPFRSVVQIMLAQLHFQFQFSALLIRVFSSSPLPPAPHELNGYFQQIRWRMKDTKDMGKYSYMKGKKNKKIHRWKSQSLIVARNFFPSQAVQVREGSMKAL